MGSRGWLLGYVVANFLAFPHPLGDTTLDLGMVFGWVAPAALLLGLRGTSAKTAARRGFGAGLAGQALLLHWLYIVTVDYGHAAPPFGFVGPLGLGAFAAVFTAAFAASQSWLRERGLASPLTAAVLWTLADHLRTFVVTGFPWGTIGYSQHANEWLLPIVTWTGVYGLSFAVVLVGALGVDLFEARRDRRRPGFATGISALVAVGWFGLAAVSETEDPAAGQGTLRVAVLQGNIEQGVKWNPAWAERTLQIYEDLSRRAAARGAQLIVYPESAVPGALNEDARLRFRMAELARETGAAFVVGSVAVERALGAPRAFYDSAFVLTAGGEFRERYDKSHLVPFGEYIPFQEIWGGLLAAVAQGIAVAGVTPGPGPRAIDLEVPDVDAPGGSRQVSAAVPICYELLFPDLVRRFVGDGAGALLAITNDAWYGRTGAPLQFLAMTAVRSAENGVWTVRAANTGVSAIIDARGRVLEQTGLFESDLLVADVPLRPPPVGGTFYTRYGDVFVSACWLAAGALAVAGRIRGSRRGKASDPDVRIRSGEQGART